MASLLGKLVGDTHKEDELPPDYAGALPVGHGGATTTTPQGLMEETIQPKAEVVEYKTVVEGTGAGYGDLKEHVMQAELGPMEKHVVEENTGLGGSVGSSQGSFGSEEKSVGGVEGKHLHDKAGKQHTGPMQKIKEKVKVGLAKVRHKKKDRAGAGDSSSSSSSDNESGPMKEKTHQAGLSP